MNPNVFISHSSVDREAAKSICSALEHRGLACWIASRDVGPGQNYMDAIVRAIRGAKVMVLVFSQNANISGEILKELSLASKYKVSVIPARIEDVVPSEAFELEFATRQWVDLFNDWEFEIGRLASWIISTVPVDPDSQKSADGSSNGIHPSHLSTTTLPQTPENESQRTEGRPVGRSILATGVSIPSNVAALPAGTPYADPAVATSRFRIAGLAAVGLAIIVLLILQDKYRFFHF